MEDWNEESLLKLCIELGDQVDTTWSTRYRGNGEVGGTPGEVYILKLIYDLNDMRK